MVPRSATRRAADGQDARRTRPAAARSRAARCRRAGSAPAVPLSVDPRSTASRRCTGCRSRSARLGVLGHVGQQFADREVGGRLDRAGAAVQVAGRSMRSGVTRVGPGSRRPAAVGQHRRSMPRTKARSSAGALTEESPLGRQRSRGIGVGVDDLPAAYRVMPMATSPACTPSCRSRSIRRFDHPGVEDLGAGLIQVTDPQGEFGLLGGATWTGRKGRSRASATGLPTTRRPRRRWPARGPATRCRARSRRAPSTSSPAGKRARSQPMHPSTVTHSRSRQVAWSVSQPDVPAAKPPAFPPPAQGRDRYGSAMGTAHHRPTSLLVSRARLRMHSRMSGLTTSHVTIPMGTATRPGPRLTGSGRAPAHHQGRGPGQDRGQRR